MKTTSQFTPSCHCEHSSEVPAMHAHRWVGVNSALALDLLDRFAPRNDEQVRTDNSVSTFQVLVLL